MAKKIVLKKGFWIISSFFLLFIGLSTWGKSVIKDGLTNIPILTNPQARRYPCDNLAYENLASLKEKLLSDR